MTKEKEKVYISTVGRRKRSSCRVRLYTGKGSSIVNAKPIKDYFKDIAESVYTKPLTLTDNTGKVYFTALVTGGGKMGQVDAYVHGVARALVKHNEEKNRKILRQAGLLTRDPRERERRKPGLAQGARAKKQSPKR